MHSTHHTLAKLFPLDTFYLDFIDHTIYVILTLYLPFLFTNNFFEYTFIILLSLVHSTYLHSDILASFPLPMFIDSKYHTLHHSVGMGNYSIFFPFWDDYMGTRIKEIIVEKTDTKLSMDEFNSMCKNGRKLTIINNEVIDCEKWIHSHPGGKTVIENLIGKDSTKEFNTIHGETITAKKMLHTLKIAEIEVKS